MYGELVPIGGGDNIPLLRPILTVGRRETNDVVLRFSNVLCAAACIVAGLAIVVVWTVLSGSRLRDTLNAVVIHASRLRTAIIRPVDFGQPWPFAIVVLVFVCVRSWLWFRPKAAAGQGPPTVLKVTLALAALLLGGMMIPEFYMVLVAPVCWLIVRPDGRNPIDGSAMPARLFRVDC